MRALALTLSLLLPALSFAKDEAPDPKLVDAVKGYLAAKDDKGRDEAAKTLAPFDNAPVADLSNAIRAAVTYGDVKDPVENKFTLSIKNTQHTKQAEVSYVARLPKAYDPAKAYGLLYFILGPGTDSQATFDIWTPEKLNDEFVVVSPTMPPDDPRFPGYPDYDTADQAFDAVVLDVMKTVHIDPDRVFAAGFSMGANFTWSFADFQPDRLAGVIPASGREPDGTMPDCMRNSMWCPAFVTYGDQEVETPVTMTRDLVKRLRSYGYSIEYKELAGWGHAWPAKLEPDMIEWMSKHTRNRDPKKLYQALRWWTKEPRRFYWVTPVKGEKHGEMQVSLDKNTIDVKAKLIERFIFVLNDAMVDFGQDVVVKINGKEAFHRKVPRSARVALDEFLERWDASDLHVARIFAAAQ